MTDNTHDIDEENLAKNIECSNWYKVSPQYSDNPLVGILLCTDKGSQMVEYALSGMDNHFFVSTYMLHLPDKTKLKIH